MRTILTTLLATAALPAFAADPQFVRVHPDQSSYTVGSKAVIFAYMDRLPIEPTKELFAVVKIAGEAVNMIPLSSHLAVALPGRFESPGVHSAESNIFVQDKSEQIQLAQGIALHQREIDLLLRELEKEKDPEGREILEKRISEKRTKVTALQLQAENARVLIEVGVTSIPVNPASRSKISSIFTLAADRSPAIYAPGDRAIFTAHLNSLFQGPEGPKEHIFRGKIGATSLPSPVVVGDDYAFTSPVFSSSDLGDQSFTANLFIRSKAQADLLRSAYTLARKQKAAFERSLGEAANPSEEAYLEWKVGEMNRVMSALSGQLEAILLAVDSEAVEFTVE